LIIIGGSPLPLPLEPVPLLLPELLPLELPEPELLELEPPLELLLELPEPELLELEPELEPPLELLLLDGAVTVIVTEAVLLVPPALEQFRL